MSKPKDPNRKCNWSWGRNERNKRDFGDCEHYCKFPVSEHPDAYHYCCGQDDGEMWEGDEHG